MKARAFILSIAFLTASYQQAFAETGTKPAAKPASPIVRYKEIPLHFESGDRLIISVLHADVRLRGTDSADGTLKVSKSISDKASPAARTMFESATFAVRREGPTVFIEERGPDSKAKWEEWLSEPNKTNFVFEVAVAAIPAEVIVQDGSAKIDGWQEPLTISLINGQLTTSETAGALRIQMQKGSAAVATHMGLVEVDSFGAKLSVQDLDGSLDLTNFGGDSQLTRVKGRVEMLAHAGSTSIANSSGYLEFVNGRGALNLSDFDGQVRGETDLGSLSLGFKGEPEVDIASEKGNVAVRLPANSGASLQLQSDEGGINTPEAIETEIRTGFLSASGAARKPNSPALISGALTGRGPKGRIAVRSKSGAIRIR